MNYKQQLIADNIEARENEITVYELNIANYEHAACAAEREGDMAEFAADLRQRIEAERFELRKARLIFNALKAQK